MLGRNRFAELVGRQLDLFETDASALLAKAAEADSAWTRAAREDSEDLYGDYQLVVDEVAERLLDLRETYVGSLDEQTASEYRTAFNRAANKRFRAYAALLGDD